MLYIINSLVFLFLYCAWSKSTFTNHIMRFIFISLVISNGVYAVYSFGYIINISGVK